MSLRAAIAAHRFGLGEPSLDRVGPDPEQWLSRQIGPADAALGRNLPTTAEALKAHTDFVRQQRDRRQMAADGRTTEERFGQHFRRLVHEDLRSRLGTAAVTERPFAERLALFWANHFTVSMAKAPVRGLVGSFEREAIRPYIAGKFEHLLGAAVRHPAMLRYLDNDRSAGPSSLIVQRLKRRSEGEPRISGLNENLAREVLELHTLGVDGGGRPFGGWGGYSQADIIEFARVLTGWRVPLRALEDNPAAPLFDATWHDPGTKTVLGRRYSTGPEALPSVLHDLARHPSTARFIAFKLARHFVADDPPPTLVAALADSFHRTEGDLTAVYRTLLASPLAWDPAPVKLKTPEEYVISAVRLLKLGAPAFARAPDAGISALGQRVHAAPSPAGWPDQAVEWLGPDAIWKRVEWTTRVAGLAGAGVDARALARTSLGPRLSDDTQRQIERAADAEQALALLLLAPEFQRR